jgi:hypothetical protein
VCARTTRPTHTEKRTLQRPVLSSLGGHRTNSRTQHPAGPHPHNAYRLWDLQAGLQVDLSSTGQHTEVVWPVDSIWVTVMVAADNTAPQGADSRSAQVADMVRRSRAIETIEAADSTVAQAVDSTAVASKPNPSNNTDDSVYHAPYILSITCSPCITL